MKKQVVFISGGEVFETRDDFKKWLASSESDFMLPQPGSESVTFWSRNLQEDLGDDYEVLSISMPLKQHARYDEWKIWFEKHVQFMHDEVVLVGWSLGATFLFKYFSENSFKKEITSLHLVAGRYGELKSFEYAQDITLQSKMEVFVYHSSDDFVVPFEDAQKFRDVSKGELLTFKDRNHFLQEEFPELLENIRNN